MNVLNRVVTILLLLALIPVFTVGLIAPREAIELLRDGLDELHAQLDPSPSTVQMLIRVLLAVVIDAVLVFLLYLQVRRPVQEGVPVKRVEGSEAQIAIDSVVGRLSYQIDRLPGVLSVEPSVVSRRRGVEVALDIEMAADVNLTANIEQVSAVARGVVEDDLGLKLRGKPKINLRTVPYPEPAPAVEIERELPAEPDAGPELGGPAPAADAELIGDSGAGEVHEPGSVDAPD
jgi:hypothetical protein